MRILIFHPWATFEFAMEVAQSHLDAGDEVTLLTCDGSMPACHINPQHWRSNCARCVHLRGRALSLLSPHAKIIPYIQLTDANRRELAGVRYQFGKLQDLMDYTIDNFHIGLMVAGQLLSLTRSPRPDTKRYENIIHMWLLAGVSVYRSTQNHLSNHRYDRCYTYNGRSPEARGFLEACRSGQVPHSIIDYGCDWEHYLLAHDTSSMHDLHNWVRMIRRHWESAIQSPCREQLAREWYIDKVNRCDRIGTSFVLGQDKGCLPAGFSNAEHNIAVYTSSDDELVAGGPEWRNLLYIDQLDGLRRLHVSLITQMPGVHIYLRVHPNVRHQWELYRNDFQAFNGPHFTVISPREKIDTYALMEACNTVLTFGSTMGIEAVFWGKPSVLAGRALYEDFGGTYNPASHEELIEMLKQPLAPKPEESALIYGYWHATNGHPFMYFSDMQCPVNGFRARGRFRGNRIQETWLSFLRWGVVRSLPWLQRMIDKDFLRRTLARLLP